MQDDVTCIALDGSMTIFVIEAVISRLTNDIWGTILLMSLKVVGDDAILDKRAAIEEPLLSFWSKYSSDAFKDYMKSKFCIYIVMELREMLEANNQVTPGSELDLHDRWHGDGDR
ncbi:hypothetical protein Tco_0535279 [Tanacetum coccineum]